MVATLLLALAFIAFVLATFGVPVPRVSLVAFGLACWVLVALIGAWPGA